MSTGRQTTVHFAPVPEREPDVSAILGNGADPTLADANSGPLRDFRTLVMGETRSSLMSVPESRPSIVTWGRMSTAAKHVNKELAHLPMAEGDYHGTLLTILSAVMAIESDIRLLLKLRDEKGEF